jgi:hypothetical protein
MAAVECKESELKMEYIRISTHNSSKIPFSQFERDLNPTGISNTIAKAFQKTLSAQDFNSR